MIASCGCRVKSYRAKYCSNCGKWFCPACHSEHVSSPGVYCPVPLTFVIKDGPQRSVSLEALQARLATGEQLPEKYRRKQMPKYRKKPIVIEAFQMTKERRWDNSEWPEWLHRAWNTEPGEGSVWIDSDAPIAEGHESAAELVCGTLEGVHRISWDDWIIKGVKGELYLCKPDIFEVTYEPVL